MGTGGVRMGTGGVRMGTGGEKILLLLLLILARNGGLRLVFRITCLFKTYMS